MSDGATRIDNGAGEVLYFEGRVVVDGRERVIGGSIVQPGAGPPMHVHYLQDEVFTVIEGRMGYQRPGAEPVYAGPGETAFFPAGDPHRFWNAGDGVLRCSAYIEPPGNIEFFLGALFASQRANGGRRPSLWDVAWLAHRYRSEYALLVVPRLVQRVLFPVVIALGTLLGKYAKYADAPEPGR